jgi:plastocyanin
VGSSDVRVFDFGYSPASKTVPVGSTVRFVNTGIALHTVTDRAGRFDSGLIAGGAAFSRRFDVAGTYDIFCTLHPEMTARLAVTDSTGTAPAPPPPTTTTTLAAGSTPRGNVQMRDFSFAPSSISVRSGSSLTFVNTGAAPHTVTAADRSFDSGLVQPGGVYTRRFTQPGVIQYVCTLHPAMIGTITVLDAAGNAPPVSTTTSALAGAGEGAPPAASVAVEIIDLDYRPRTVTVPAGTEVLWTNTGVAPHTVTARDGSFTSELLQTGGQYRRVFDQAGSFEYFCTLHPDMVGTVIVEGVVTAAPSGGETVDVAAPDSDADPEAAAKPDPAGAGMGWIVVGLVAAMVFGGGVLVMAMLRRSLLTS